MLLPHIDNTEPYLIRSDRKTLSVGLVTQAMLMRNGPIDALWHRVAGDTPSFDALLRWCAIRRDRWQEWGQLAEALGREAFAAHMRQRLEVEPAGVCLGALVRGMDNPCQISLAEVFHGPQGLFQEPLMTHRFASPTARDCFFEWLFTDDNIDQLNALASTGYCEGAIAVGKALDEIAANPVTASSAKRRRKSKTTAKWHGQASV